MVLLPFSVIVVSPCTVTGVVMFLFSQVTLPEMVSSVLAAAFPETADTPASTADAGTPGIVKIIAAASKNAAGRFHFHFIFILFILLTWFVSSRCFLKQLGYCLPQLIFRHRL